MQQIDLTIADNTDRAIERLANVGLVGITIDEHTVRVDIPDNEEPELIMWELEQYADRLRMTSARILPSSPDSGSSS